MTDREADAPNDCAALKAWRRRMGWAQARVADELGVFAARPMRERPGVRLAGERPNIIRRPTERDFYPQVGSTVEWQSGEIGVQVPGDVLDDSD